MQGEDRKQCDNSKGKPVINRQLPVPRSKRQARADRQRHDRSDIFSDRHRHPERNPRCQHENHLRLFFFFCCLPVGIFAGFFFSRSCICCTKEIIPVYHQGKISGHAIHSFCQCCIPTDLSPCNRLPDVPRRLDHRRCLPAACIQHRAAVFSEHDLPRFSQVCIADFQHALFLVEAVFVIKRRHLPGKGQHRIFLFAAVFFHAPARIRHFFKYISRIQKFPQLFLHAF